MVNLATAVSHEQSTKDDFNFCDHTKWVLPIVTFLFHVTFAVFSSQFQTTRPLTPLLI